MAIPDSVKDREREKFLEAIPGSGNTAVRTAGSGSILAGLEYDAIAVGYPDTVTETYSCYTGGLLGTLVATVTVVYTSASKQLISTVVRT